MPKNWTGTLPISNSQSPPAQVSKKLMLLFVRHDGPLDASTPKCLTRFSVQERLMRRWVPESHRPIV